MVTTLVMYMLCKHMKLKTLVTCLALQQIKEVGAVANQDYISSAEEMECTSKIQWYTVLMLSSSIFGLIAIATMQTSASVTYVQLTNVPAVPIQPEVTISNQPQKSPDYCVLCTPARRQCPNNCPLPHKSEWSDSEEEENNFDRKNEEE